MAVRIINMEPDGEEWLNLGSCRFTPWNMIPSTIC